VKLNKNTQVPNLAVYVFLYALVFGISIWVLMTDRESPTNWLVYALMIGAVLSGAIQFAVHSWKRQRAA